MNRTSNFKIDHINFILVDKIKRLNCYKIESRKTRSLQTYSPFSTKE